MKNLLQVCILIFLLGLLVFFAVSLYLAQWAVKPVAKAWDQQKQFVADASHELKTPLTVILANAEMLQTPEYSQQSREQFSRNILTMARQMRGLVENLLDLARTDDGSQNGDRGAVDLSKLTSDALLPFEPLYFENGLQLSSQVEEGIWLWGNPRQLRQVLDILLDNAQKYCASGGEVEVRLARRNAHHCFLSVSNPGGPLSKEELENIFKRFYRVDQARSMNCSYGLGLPIAESIVTSHRGKIWAESAGGIVTFLVRLPIQ